MPKFEVKTQKGKSIFLKDEDEIYRGGEGRILMMPAKTGQVAKIYHPGIKGIDQNRFNQLQVLDKELFIRPIDLLFQNGNIAGYTMEYAGADFFPLSALFSQNFILRNGIDDKYKENLAGKLIDAVKSAHFAGFVIGDLNQFNVLVNLKGCVKFIDVDSYETPGHKHTGMLLDDIRDYYYQGMVNMNSDYFALSVLIFNLFTYTHPFKGIHQKYKTLAERMIRKIPVFLDDPLLKAPKCYQPLKMPEAQDEFNKIYLEGQRFLLSIDRFAVLKPVQKPPLKTMITSDELIIQMVIDSTQIRNVQFNHNTGYVETDECFIFFSAEVKGRLTKLFELDKKLFSDVFIGSNHIFACKNNRLLLCNANGQHQEIQNFIFPDNSCCYQLGNILIVICSGQMYWLYLDEVLNQSIRNKRVEIFSESFSLHSGLMQNTGGVKRIFYNTGKDIASVKADKPIKRIFQVANTGIIQYIENKKVENQYFKISGLNIEFVTEKPENFFEFGYSQVDKENGYIFEPGENKILIRRTQDFEVVSEIPCSQVSTQTPLFYTHAGIIIWEKDKIYLVNQKK